MIRTIDSIQEFDNLTESWRTLQTDIFGPLGRDEDVEEDTTVLVAEVDGNVAGYLISEFNELWHIEVAESARGCGLARQLCEAANISFAWEVCSDEGAALCESLNIDFEDCR